MFTRIGVFFIARIGVFFHMHTSLFHIHTSLFHIHTFLLTYAPDSPNRSQSCRNTRTLLCLSVSIHMPKCLFQTRIDIFFTCIRVVFTCIRLFGRILGDSGICKWSLVPLTCLFSIYIRLFFGTRLLCETLSKIPESPSLFGRISLNHPSRSRTCRVVAGAYVVSLFFPTCMGVFFIDTRVF